MKKPEKSFFDMNMQERWNETLGSFIQRDFSVVDASVFSSYLASGDSGKFCFRQFDFAGCSKSHETSEEKRTLCEEHFQSVDSVSYTHLARTGLPGSTFLLRPPAVR